MTEFSYRPNVDPVGAEARMAEPERDQVARQLEPLVGVEIHWKFDAPLDPDDRSEEQRVHIVSYPEGWEPPLPPNRSYVGPLAAGWVYYLAGAWFWRPSWSAEGSPSVLDQGGESEDQVRQEPSEELVVDSEEEAKRHARRRVAWHLAGGGTHWV